MVCIANYQSNLWFGVTSQVEIMCDLFKPYHSKQVCTLSQLFFNLYPNQAWAAALAAKVWFGRGFKNHCRLTRVVCTHFN